VYIDIIRKFSAEEAWRKLQYVRDKRKIIKKKNQDCKQSGSATDDQYQPLWWYDRNSFLDIQVTLLLQTTSTQSPSM